MKTKTRVRAGGMVGGIALNHNETLVQDSSKAKGLKVKTHVRAGGIGTSPSGLSMNHNETLVLDTPSKR
jgi:hypothetical protein